MYILICLSSKKEWPMLPSLGLLYSLSKLREYKQQRKKFCGEKDGRKNNKNGVNNMNVEKWSFILYEKNETVREKEIEEFLEIYW